MTANTSTQSTTTQTTQKILKGYITRIENLEEEKKNIASDIKDVYNEAANEGFDKKALREVIRRRRKSKAEITELEGLVELYESSIS